MVRRYTAAEQRDAMASSMLNVALRDAGLVPFPGEVSAMHLSECMDLGLVLFHPTALTTDGKRANAAWCAPWVAELVEGANDPGCAWVGRLMTRARDDVVFRDAALAVLRMTRRPSVPGTVAPTPQREALKALLDTPPQETPDATP